MARVKRGTHHVKRRRNILKKTKGYRWGRKSKLKLAKTAALKAGVYAYRDRRNLKRERRSLWLIRMNAALRAKGLKYSTFIHSSKARASCLTARPWLIWPCTTGRCLIGWLRWSVN